jgi:multiple sugar transport system permease protein
LAVLLLVLVMPLAYCTRLSLYEHSLRTGQSGFAGLENYLQLFRDARFLWAAARTAGFVAVSLSLELALGLGLALLMHHLARGRGLFRAAVMVPWAIPTVVSGLLWAWIFNDRLGLANALLRLMGVEALAWLASPGTSWVALIAAEVWKTSPFVSLIILAGLQMVPKELYESAEMDGAGPWKKFTGVTLPILWPTILLAMLFRTMDALRVFDLIVVMTGGGPAGSTEVLSFYNYKVLFTHLDFGYGSAISVGLFVLVMAGSLAYVRALLGGVHAPAR